jgi:L-rhamnose mutarotase
MTGSGATGTDGARTSGSPIRHASVIMLKPEMEAAYRRLHASVWPTVASRIAQSNITNYSIFLRDGQLFSYFEYRGADFDADMAAMRADEQTQAWWGLTDPCQQPVPSAAPGQWWAPLEEVFHLD